MQNNKLARDCVTLANFVLFQLTDSAEQYYFHWAANLNFSELELRLIDSRR